LRALVNLPQDQYDAYFRSHDVMGKERLDSRADEQAVVDWYNVVNHFCALGACEKMYIPPTIDPSVGNVANQVLFEQRMADELGAKAGTTILDMGCGKGRIAHQVATHRGAKVVGINYDRMQVQDAVAFAERKGLLGRQLEFHHGSFNDPLPFGNESFDGGYEIGAFCYVIDKVKVFSEIFRVLRPGAKFSYTDWVRVNYDEGSAHHRELLRQVKPLTGMVEMPAPAEMEDAFVRSGFEVEFSGEASTGGKQLAHLLHDTNKSFWLLAAMVDALDWAGLLPSNLGRLYKRLRVGGEALMEAVDLDLFTMSYQIIVRKPGGVA